MQAVRYANGLDDPVEAAKHRSIAEQINLKRRFGGRIVTAYFHDYFLRRGWPIEPWQAIPPDGVKHLYGTLQRIDSNRGGERVVYIGHHDDTNPRFTVRFLVPHSPDIYMYPARARSPHQRHLDYASQANGRGGLIIEPQLHHTREVIGYNSQDLEASRIVPLAAIDMTQLHESDGSQEQFPFPTIIAGRTAIKQWAEYQAEKPDNAAAAEFAAQIRELPLERWPVVTYRKKYTD